MVVVIHQATGMAEPAKAPSACCEHTQEQISIFIIQKDRRTSVAGASDVIDRTGKFQT
jgi:hypothetical protein